MSPKTRPIWTAARGLPGPPARPKLAHGTRCVSVERPGIYAPYDGLLTDPARPAALADRRRLLSRSSWRRGHGSRLRALRMAGRRPGGAGGITARVAEALPACRRPSSTPGSGPGSAPAAIPVGEEVAASFSAERLRTRRRRTLHLDLGAAIADDLRAPACLPERIGRRLCTSCSPDLFFSYRRDGARSGRMAAVIWR